MVHDVVPCMQWSQFSYFQVNLKSWFEIDRRIYKLRLLSRFKTIILPLKKHVSLYLCLELSSEHVDGPAASQELPLFLQPVLETER